MQPCPPSPGASTPGQPCPPSPGASTPGQPCLPSPGASTPGQPCPPSPGASTPGQPWVVLRRMACTDPGLPQGTGFCLAIGSPAPNLTELFVSPLIDGCSGDLVHNPSVLVADPSGFLLLSGSGGDSPARPPYFLCDAVSNTVRQLPYLSAEYDTDSTGLFVTPNDHTVMVVDLVVPEAISPIAILRCWSPETGGEWIYNTVRIQPPAFRHQWHTDRVLSCDGKIWWVDLSQGLLWCEPRLPAEILGALHFVPFPNLRPSFPNLSPSSRFRRDRRPKRSVHLSRGELRYVAITHARVPKIKLWTLAEQKESCHNWKLDYEVSFQELWDDQNYGRTGLPNTVPALVLVHPNDPDVVYFAQEERLFSFNLRMKTVIQCAANDIGIDEAFSGALLAWKLPPSLKISPGPSPATSAFDTLASSFCDAFDRALMDMEFHQFTRTALAHLNKNIAKEENKLKVSELLAICYFDDDDVVNGRQEYAHINFNAHAGSKMVLVFAELAKTVEGREPWTLKSCKKLNKNRHGGLHGEDVDMERSQGTRKRKRSLYCFACMGGLMHPKGGFYGGHGGSESYEWQ